MAKKKNNQKKKINRVDEVELKKLYYHYDNLTKYYAKEIDKYKREFDLLYKNFKIDVEYIGFILAKLIPLYETALKKFKEVRIRCFYEKVDL